MMSRALDVIYHDYIACLNARDWPRLDAFVAAAVVYNGREVGLAGYRAMLAQNVGDIPDLRFDVDLLLVDPPHLASRLRFDCTPKGAFLGLPVDGRRVVFTENVFYRLRDERIEAVWSVLDKAAVEAQL